MKNTLVSAMAIVLISGGEMAMGVQDPVRLEPTHAVVNKVAHIYYNAVSGERVVTLLADGQTAPADTGASQQIWSSTVENTCEAFGYTTEFFYALDNPDSQNYLSTGATLLDYGDIELDTVVDCIEVNWVVAHPDTDLNQDGVGDGVEELAANWVMWEPDNGRANSYCARIPILDLLIYNLPGNIPSNASLGERSAYTMDVDLVAFGSSTNLSFEIGDSDGDCQSAAFCNNDVDTNSDGIGDGVSIANVDLNFDGLPDADWDGDGLFDWSWSVRFLQPGIGNDFDSDSDTGTPAGSASDTIGVGFGAPAGSAVDNGDGTFTWNIDTSVADAGTGQEDRFALFNPPNSTGAITYNGGYWFGGFACTGGLISQGGLGYTPPAMFQFVLYGPSSVCCCQDINGDGVLNFFDVSAFLTGYNAGTLDYNGDGSINFFDVSVFLTDYNAGCP